MTAAAMNRRRTVVSATAVLLAGLLSSACTGSTSHPQSSASPVTVAPSTMPVTPGSSSSANSSASPTSGVSDVPSVRIRTVQLSQLDGATVPTTFLLEDDTANLTEAKFFLTTSGMTFLASVKEAPFQTSVSVGPGKNTILVRNYVDGNRTEVSVSFVAKGGLLKPGPISTPPSPPSSMAPPTATARVSNAAGLASALAHAGPGAVIRLGNGVYRNAKGRPWQLAASGTATQPITLEGGRGAILDAGSTGGAYGLWITGSYWQVLGLTVRDAGKGIVLDRSQHTVIDGVEVADIGDEGVHFRTCSSWDVLQNSYVHDTGMESKSYGEGVYVGSANSNWSKYGCANGEDGSQHTLIRDNRFVHIAAEGADLKEGTTSGWLIGNVFSDTGYSGQNSADSAVDVKGNGWTIAQNTAADPRGADQDAFQTHTVYAGDGTANVFRANTVRGSWPGFGFGLYPALANIVTCDNRAPGAAQGLVGNGSTRIRCAS